MNSLYLQDRVNSVAHKKPNCRMYEIQAAVDKRIHEEALLPGNQKLLAKEVSYERQKAEHEKKKHPDDLFANDVGSDDDVEPETEIVTLLLVFQKISKEEEDDDKAEEKVTTKTKKNKKKSKKRASKALSCITLWADGPTEKSC